MEYWNSISDSACFSLISAWQHTYRDTYTLPSPWWVNAQLTRQSAMFGFEVLFNLVSTHNFPLLLEFCAQQTLHYWTGSLSLYNFTNVVSSLSNNLHLILQLEGKSTYFFKIQFKSHLRQKIHIALYSLKHEDSSEGHTLKT